MGAVFKVSNLLTLNTRDFTTSLKQAGAQMLGFDRNTRQNVGRISGSFRKLTGEIGRIKDGLIAAAAAWGITRLIGDMDDLSTTARRLNVDFNELRKLQYIFGDDNVAGEELAKSLRKLIDVVGNAKTDKTIFKKWKLDANEFMRMDVEGRLKAIARRMSQLSEDQQVSMALDLLGKSGDKMIPTLTQGMDKFNQRLIDAEKYVHKFNAADQAAFNAADTAILNVKTTFVDMLKTALLPLMPAITSIAESLAKFFKMIADSPVASTVLGWGAAFIALKGSISSLSRVGKIVKTIATPGKTKVAKVAEQVMNAGSMAADYGISIPESVPEAVKKLPSLLSRINEIMTKQYSITGVLKSGWTTLTRGIGSFITAVKGFSIAGMIASLRAGMVAMWGFATSTWSAVAPLLPFIAAILLVGAAIALLCSKSLRDYVRNLEWVRKVTDGLYIAFGFVWDGITTGFANMWDSIITSMENGVLALVQWVSRIAEKIVKPLAEVTGSDMLKDMADKLDTMATSAQSTRTQNRKDQQTARDRRQAEDDANNLARYDSSIFGAQDRGEKTTPQSQSKAKPDDTGKLMVNEQRAMNDLLRKYLTGQMGAAGTKMTAPQGI